MQVIDIVNRIAKGEELPKEIYYNGDYGELIQDEHVTNYFMYSKNSKFEFYWLIDHRLNNLNDKILIKSEYQKQYSKQNKNSHNSH